MTESYVYEKMEECINVLMKLARTLDTDGKNDVLNFVLKVNPCRLDDFKTLISILPYFEPYDG